MMDPKEIINNLEEISKSTQAIGNRLKSLSAATDDIDVVTLISSLSTDAYNLSLSIDESVDTYKEILEEEMEELEELGDEDDIPDEEEEDLELSEPETV